MRLRRERGSVLMLMPAAMLIVVVLGAIAVDSAIAFLGERELASLTAAAANDAATSAIDTDRLRRDGTLVLDPERARRTVLATLANSSIEVRLTEVAVRVTAVDGRPAVEVRLSGTVDYLFADAIPGSPDRRFVSASSTAVADTG